MSVAAPPPQRADPGIGDEVVPGYDVVKLLRTGGRLLTYDVYSRERDCRCVVKTLRTDREDEAHCRDALLVEGRLLRDLAHPHLVRAYEAFTHPRTAVVLETLTGDTLAAVIEDAPLTASDVALLGGQLASVLGYLHRQGWLHLDVKPSNVIVQGGRAVLIDLSVANQPGHGRPHAGTYGYLSPEQARGRDLSPACDVFGLGVTLGEALTGLLPYGEEAWRRPGTRPRPGRTFRRRLDQAPGRLASLIHAAIDPDAALRPTLRELRAALTTLTPGDVHP